MYWASASSLKKSRRLSIRAPLARRSSRRRADAPPHHGSNMQKRHENAALWTLQVLLAALFLYAGAMKFLIPAADLAAVSTLPVAFLHFIGVAEILGALGLVLPGLFRVQRQLTPLAAAGLSIIMIGATAITGAVLGAAVPFVVGLACAVVAYRRSPAHLRYAAA
ncbi:MAG TPA: DoxX family protein [Polyangiales bacterium]|nr:DoxX family protein [Polyangiales bacterium]